MITTGIAGVELPDPAQQLDAGHAGKAHIGKDHVGAQALEQAERLLPVTRHLGLVPRLGEKRLDRPGEGALVVHDQDGAAHAGISVGSRSRTVVPAPGRLSISSRPPFCST